MSHTLPVYGVKAAEGVRLTLEDGRELIDGTSSWWACVHGYSHPAILNAMEEQLKRLSHVMFGGITHESAIELCRQLITITPEPLTKVFLADSGSISVEVALKMALQYWQGQNKTEKNRIMTVKQGYHGDTFAAMSVCDPEGGMHTPCLVTMWPGNCLPRRRAHPSVKPLKQMTSPDSRPCWPSTASKPPR